MSSLRERIRGSPLHTGAPFEAHLEGTAALLRSWGCRAALTRAGRYHAVYGVPAGRAAVASQVERELIAEIGVEAERLVQLWSRIDRDALVAAARELGLGDLELALAGGGTTRVSAEEGRDLIHLHAANQLEMARRRGAACRELDPLRPVLCAEAVASLDRQQRPARRLASWLACRLRGAR